ncbi:hypothetical protein TanjilG_16250 [Lupinus angustifolius]|uniref:F-box domain-containing protein n=1 Tax=Lupinus angustifolius TaxID=3871 RepID=A0A1J7HF59_LUPAN|nr:PREDICTED: F-box/kelch-repeat protein At3g23880-like [Lupinus angustifolius]OIW01001.1 hypothetical protein TanjilG_16250 [Lupinus angustifolius]
MLPLMEIPASGQPVFSDDLIMQILSWLPVMYLLQFRCVAKSWKSLISLPTFIKLHLERSPRNANLFIALDDIFEDSFSVMYCCKHYFLEYPSSVISDEGGGVSLTYKYCFIGSCNGLVCLHGSTSEDGEFEVYEYNRREYWFRICNPALGLRSKKSPLLCVDLDIFDSIECGFGYDKSSDTYKVVAILSNTSAMEDSERTQVKVYAIGEHCWRDIQPFPAFPYNFEKQGRFLSGTINWLAVQNYSPEYDLDEVTIDQLVIVSLDLGKETYQQFLLPDGLNEAHVHNPRLVVLMDCLCLSYDYKITYFVLWQMKEFGIEKSWTQLVKVSYEYLQIKRFPFPLPGPRFYSSMPLCMSDNGDVLMLIDDQVYEVILYNMRDRKVQHTGIPKHRFQIYAADYVESLILP